MAAVPVSPRLRLAALLALAPLACGAVEFGTLFTSAEERARLERLRRGEPVAAVGTVAAPTANPALTGYVSRSDGRNTLWIDGLAVPTSDPRARVLLDPREVRDEAPRLPPSAVRRVPAPAK